MLARAKHPKRRVNVDLILFLIFYFLFFIFNIRFPSVSRGTVPELVERVIFDFLFSISDFSNCHFNLRHYSPVVGGW
jgi:hypothetical protein